MADFFSNLAGQVLGAAAEVRPLLPPRFALWPELLQPADAPVPVVNEGAGAVESGFAPPLIDPGSPDIDVPLPDLRRMAGLASAPDAHTPVIPYSTVERLPGSDQTSPVRSHSPLRAPGGEPFEEGAGARVRPDPGAPPDPSLPPAGEPSRRHSSASPGRLMEAQVTPERAHPEEIEYPPLRPVNRTDRPPEPPPGDAGTSHPLSKISRRPLITQAGRSEPAQEPDEGIATPIDDRQGLAAPQRKDVLQPDPAKAPLEPAPGQPEPVKSQAENKAWTVKTQAAPVIQRSASGEARPAPIVSQPASSNPRISSSMPQAATMDRPVEPPAPSPIGAPAETPVQQPRLAPSTAPTTARQPTPEPPIQAAPSHAPTPLLVDAAASPVDLNGSVSILAGPPRTANIPRQPAGFPAPGALARPSVSDASEPGIAPAPNPTLPVIESALAAAQEFPPRPAFEEPKPIPTVRVIIGRVVVRAEPPAGQSPSRQTALPRPPLSLEDYLKERKGGGR